ncbi:MAG TPA: SCP2 sterol-binding domain-containing protein [Candidatus Nitrosotalea sp.]|nr:SCP2 sterol-binding domain-containing protein [Candidatus Nitrosotalea sp.]
MSMECKVRDITMTYDEAGTGTPLLVLDGWGYSGHLTMIGSEPVYESRTGWRRLYPELPGHGKTPMPTWLKAPDDMLDALLEFMEAVAPGEQFAVTGASWGAYLALGLLHRRPNQLVGMMLDIPGLGRLGGDTPTKQVIRRDPEFAAALQPGEEWMGHVLVVQTRAMVDTLRALMAYWTPLDPAFAPTLQGKSFSFDAHILSEPFTAPTLFVTGRQDHLAGYKDAWSILDSFPRGTFAVLDRAGHLLDFEQPVLQKALINEWLDRIEEYTTQKSQPQEPAAPEEDTSTPRLSPDQVVAALPTSLVPAMATNAVVQFDLSGKAGGKWWVKIHDGTAESGKGQPSEVADLTFLADAGDWVRIMTGELDGVSAFMQGKLQMKGDRTLAMKFQSMFTTPN